MLLMLRLGPFIFICPNDQIRTSGGNHGGRDSGRPGCGILQVHVGLSQNEYGMIPKS